MADTNGDTRPGFLSNILAIVGFIILIVVVIWGLVNLASISRGWFSSLFGGGKENVITVSAPATTTAGTAFTVSWTYDEPVDGTYAFLYQCRSGFQFQTPGVNGVQNGIPCGAAFTINAPEKKLSVTPLHSGAGVISVPLSVIFMPSATGTQAQGSATVAIVPASTPVTPDPTPTLTPTPTPTPTPTGPADLSVTILSVTVDAMGAGVATFDITNVGNSASGAYYFSAQLPVMQSYNYTSPQQASLAPGAHIVSTLRFTQAQSGIFSVSVDPSNTVRESNENNNNASQSVNAPYSPSAQGYWGTQYNSSYNNYQYNYSQTAGYPYGQYMYPGYNQYQYGYQYPYQTSYPYAY